MKQNRRCARSNLAAEGRLWDTTVRAVPCTSHHASQANCVATWVKLKYCGPANDRRCASTDLNAASFSGRSFESCPEARPPWPDDFSLRTSAANAWRAMLATAASACVLLPASLVPAPPPTSQLPLQAPQLALHDTAARLVAALQPSAALAAELPSSPSTSYTPARMDAAAERMDAVRQLAAPDVRVMREVSEELSSHPAPPGAVAEANANLAATASGSGAAAAPNRQNAGTAVNMNARLKAPDLATLLAISPSEAKSLMTSERELSRLTLGSATKSFDAFCQLLGLQNASGGGGGGDALQLQRQAAGRLVVRQPRVLLVPAPELRDRFAQLQSLLSVPPATARRLAATQPGLLTHTPEALRSRLSALCGLMHLDPALAAGLSTAQPGLLTFNSAELEARAAALTAELKLNKQQTVALLRRHPRALLLPTDTLTSRLRSLATSLGVPRGAALGSVVLAAPRLAGAEEERVEEGIRELQKLLQLSRERATVVASEQPSLLLTPGVVLQERLRTMAELAQMPVDKVRAVAAEKPSLLTKSSAAMRRAVAEADVAEAAGRRNGQ